MMRSPTAPTQIADGMTVWSEGQVLADATLGLHALTHALHYGSSVFEGIRVYPTPAGAAIFRLREHVDRLYEGAATYGMTLPFEADAMFETIRATVAASGRDSAYVRPLVVLRRDHGPAGPRNDLRNERADRRPAVRRVAARSGPILGRTVQRDEVAVGGVAVAR